MQRGRTGKRSQRCRDITTSRRRMAKGAVVTIAVFLGAIGIESARAGTYVMRNCDVPGQPYAPLGPWTIPYGAYPELTISDECATGGGVTFNVEGSQPLPGGVRTIGISRPTGPRGQIKLVKAVFWYAARLVGSGQPLSFWTRGYRTAESYYQGLSSPPPGSENLVGEQVMEPETIEFRVGLGCGPMADPPCVAANRVPLMIRGIEMTLSENEPPFVLPPSGTFVDDGPRSGPQTVVVTASDQQSGIKEIDVLLDETVVASRDFSPRCPQSDFTVCPASLDETLQINTRAVANGTHRLTVRVQDAAGNVRTLPGARAVDIANASPVESTTAPSYRFVVSFKGGSKSTTTVPYGRRVSLRGRLSEGSRPVPAGTRLDVLERLDRRGARERSTRTVTTKADGSFSLGLATSRPSRVVRLAYRPAGGGQVISRALKLRVIAASRLRASLRGRIVRFNGQVLSGPIPRGGKRIQMEGRSPGSAWTVFKGLRTNANGRFSGAYRLRVRRPGVVLKIRAIVPSEVGYGYLSSRSRAVTLRVR